MLSLTPSPKTTFSILFIEWFLVGIHLRLSSADSGWLGTKCYDDDVSYDGSQPGVESFLTAIFR